MPQLFANPRLKARSRLRKWSNTNPGEIKVLMAIILYQGLVQKPETAMYWSSNPMLATPYIRRIMTIDRFLILMRCLHFVDNTTLPQAETKAEKSFNKIKLFFEAVVSRFSIVYTPEQNIAIDESLLLWKGRLAMKQYIPLKRARFGLKSYLLCESGSGYMWKEFTHIGPAMQLEQSNDNLKTSRIVMTLLHDLLGKGYTVYMDNYYTSPTLFRELIANNTDAVGTVRLNRKNIPADLKKKIARGEIVARFCGKLMALKWHDKKDVSMMSTFHTAAVQEVVSHRGTREKPVVICDYNANMGAVDVSDQMLTSYPAERKRHKVWYKKLFRHLMNKVTLNSYVLFKKQRENKLTHVQFRIKLIERLIETYHVSEHHVRGGRPATTEGDPLRLTRRHFPTYVPATAKKVNAQRVCAVCSSREVDGKKIRKESRFQCTDCDVGLCAAPCFHIYHTVRKF